MIVSNGGNTFNSDDHNMNIQMAMSKPVKVRITGKDFLIFWKVIQYEPYRMAMLSSWKVLLG